MTWSANENLNPGPDWAPLSCSQQRLWLFTRLSAQSTAYNLGAMLWLEGELNPEALEQTINYVIARQDIVRVQFAERDGQGWQRIRHMKTGSCSARTLVIGRIRWRPLMRWAMSLMRRRLIWRRIR